MTVPFLRIPPFPGHRAAPLAEASPNRDAEVQGLATLLREARVGGAFWGKTASLPEGRAILVAAAKPETAGEATRYLRAAGLESQAVSAGHLPADADPWSLCAAADLVIADADDELLLLAALSGCRVEPLGAGRFAALADAATLEETLAAELGRWTYRDPFTGDVLEPRQAIALLARWRRLIDANRSVAAIYGIAPWKRITADALLWDGSGPVRHAKAELPAPLAPGASQVLAWIARSDARTLSQLEARGVRIGEIEDGMIRSTGLGANCVPPLSIVVDAHGPHFDPAQASELELLLETATIPEDMLRRAAALRERLVSGGISKYGQDAERPGRARESTRKQVLVTGQVADDRSVLRGGGGLDNFTLLRRARKHEPDAHIVFKPHPDVEAGHRKGHVPDAEALEYADEIDRTSSIAALLDRVDSVHVLTSLAGFEALMRGREVVTHGVPFYAGWGLTHDLGAVPPRRTRRRTLDELVAATLILYPRYLDPVTRLPCEPETLVERIAGGQAEVRSGLIRLREAQGRIKRLLGWMTGR
ncbi:MAG: beta-3-deoxy-D-manno-oct-2-ulosonic acid transferase [Novosphingobium sp.]|nr:beta-3-deoxy-D-manno-oct-2-ulosonic acid transferase [Novosphingobium sp.]